MSAPIHLNGFAPRLSPDGRLVLSGFGTVTMADLQSGQTRSYGAPGHSFPAGWLSHMVAMYTVDRNDATAEGWMVDVIDGFKPLRIAIDPSRGFIGADPSDPLAHFIDPTHLSPIMSGSGGHWAAATPVGIYFDDLLLPGSAQGSTVNGVTLKRAAAFPVQRAGAVLAKVDINPPGRDDASGYILRRWQDGLFVEDITPVVEAFYYDVLPDGRGYCYMGQGLIIVLMPDGRIVEAMVAPSGYEGTPTLFYGPGGEVWLWTSSYDAAGAFALGRRPGEQDVVKVDTPAAWLDVIFDGSEFVVAGCDDRGALRIEHVSPNAPRVRLTAPQQALRLSRPIWQGYFKYAGEPALCFVDETNAPALIKTTTDGAVVFIHAEGRDDPAAVAKEANAQATQSARALYRRPVVGTCDNFLPTGRISGVDILGVEVYAVTQTETPVDIVTRVTRCLNRLPADQRVCLVGQAYDRRGAPPFENGWYFGDGVGLQWATAKLAEHPSVIAVLWFSGGGRQGGVGDHPEYLPAHAALLAANPGAPAFPTIATTPAPPKPPPKPPTPPVPTEDDVKSRDQFYAEFNEINAFYAAPEGLQRPGGMVIDSGGIPTCDTEAMGAHGYNLLAGLTVEQVKDNIRQSHEYKVKHKHPS